MAAIITNFQSPKTLDDLMHFIVHGGKTNLDIALTDTKDMQTEWSVAKSNQIGDVVFFLCARTAVDHMRHLRKIVSEIDSDILQRYTDYEYALHEAFSGKIFAVGIITEAPFQRSDGDPTWYAKINLYQLLKAPIDLSEFKDFIKLNSFGAITKLTAEQEKKLGDMVLAKNPDIVAFKVRR